MASLLHHLLTASAKKFPGNKPVVYGAAHITYAELEKESTALAALLNSWGVTPGSCVGIHIARGIESVVTICGILKTGAAYVPIDPQCPETRLSFIINKCRIKHLLTTRDRLDKIARAFPDNLPLEKILVMDGRAEGQTCSFEAKVSDWKKRREDTPNILPDMDISPESLAYVLFTSGSTGVPKGVMLTHLNSLTFVDMAHDFFRITSADVLANNSPLHFDLSVFDLFVAFKAGACVAVVPESISIFPVKLAEFIEKSRITVWNSVPSALALLVNHADLSAYDYRALRLVLFAGEVFPLKYLRILKKMVPHARYYNIYGQTEANSSTYFPADDIPASDTAPLPIGKPFPEFEVFALDEAGKMVRAPGEKGELYVRARSVAAGYWEDPERTARSFVDDPLMPDARHKVYRTGDMVTLDADGNYIFLGRKDHMIKSRGYRIEIGEIEALLLNHPDVQSAVVVPIPDELISNRIAAVIVPKAGAAPAPADLSRYCGTNLPKYMVPEIFEIQSALPLSSSGKADRSLLAKLLREKHRQE